MNILVINAGSSSIKYQLLDMKNEVVLANGLVERIGEKVGDLKNVAYPDTDKEVVTKLEQPIANHEEGLQLAITLLSDSEKGVIVNASDIDAVGHRVVHGGEAFHEPTIIDETVIAGIKEVSALAPLHNPANLSGITVAMQLFSEVPHVAVFDTAFHQTIPAHAYMYALPYAWYEENKVRRYGFHGTSHKFVANECATLLNKKADECNVITVHLGNGCSITAVEKGQSIDTSLGMTPLEGLVMGTRSGDMDPAIHAYMARTKGYSIDDIDTMLNKESGLKGLCGMNDMRDIHSAIEKGDERAALALNVQTYRIRKYIGSYMAALGQVDALVFTAGIGENDAIVRHEVLAGLAGFGIRFDSTVNDQRAKGPLKLSTDDSSMEVWIIPTNEELAIARDVVITTS